MTDDELMETIARKSRLISHLGQVRGQLVKEAIRRGYTNAEVDAAQRVEGSRSQRKAQNKGA